MTANPADRGTRLLVFAKAPEPGRVKTRLIPALGAEGAADLQRRMLRHALGRARASAIGPVELCCAPDSRAAFFEECRREFGVELRSQGDGDLGERMRRAIDAALARAPRAIVVGSDVPALDARYLREADRALREGCECVLGPAEDGGYVLIGLARSRPGLFSGIRWGRPGVLSATRRRVAALGLRCCELPALWDVDRPGDLARLALLRPFPEVPPLGASGTGRIWNAATA